MVNKQILPGTLVVVILAIAVYLGFQPIFEAKGLSSFTKELIGGLLAALITVGITAILLKAQSQNQAELLERQKVNEQDREKNVEVFRSKLEQYLNFIIYLNKSINDGRISESEEAELRCWAMRLSLVSGKEVSAEIDLFFTQVHFLKRIPFSKGDLTSAEVSTLQSKIKHYRYISVGELVSHLKEDLGESNISKKEDVSSTQVMIDDILASMTQES